MLLHAKISVPGSDRPLLLRPRLLAAMDAASRLLFVTGSAGSGKTSLVLNYVQTLQQPVAWYSLDASDADPATFLRYLIASLATIAAPLDQKLSGLLDDPRQGNAIASAFAEAVNTLLPPATLVLDDLHSVEHNGQLDPTIAAVLNALLRYCPHLQIVIASRQMLNLDGIITLLARGEARGLSGQMLAFTDDEIAQIFAQTGDLAAPEERQRLSETCAGWATAVALALTTRTSHVLPPTDDRAMLYAYLANQVLEQLPVELSEFLIDTPVLDYLNNQRCDQLRQRTDSAEYLAELVRRNVFLAQAGTATFRYHPLFREFLLERLRREPVRYQTLVERAVVIGREEHRWAWAYEVAVQAGAWELAAEVITAAGGHLRLEGRHTTLLTWLEDLPPAYYRPPLWWLKARLLTDQGQLADALLALDFAARGTGHDRMLAELLRAHIAQLQGQLETAAELVAPYLDDPQVPGEWQPQILRIEGIRLAQQSNYEAARQRLQQALGLTRDEGALVDVATLSHDLGTVEWLLGATDRAEAYFRTADACWKQIGEGIHRSTTLNNLGMVLLQRGRLREAERQLKTALELAQQFARPRDEALVRSSLGDVAMAAGSLIEAGQQYMQAHTIAVESGYMSLANEALAGAAHSARLRGDCKALVALLDHLSTAFAKKDLDRARLKAASAGALWLLDLPGAVEAIQEALAYLPNSETAEQALFLLLHAQILFWHGHVREAAHVFAQVGERSTQLPNLLTLTCWAAASPGLLQFVAARGDALAGRLYLHMPPAVVAPSAAPMLTIRTLGTENIVRAGEPVTGGGPLTREVFFCLLAAGQQGLPTEVLRETIWGETGDPTGQALKTALKRIRRDICNVVLKNGNYVLELPPHTDYDVARFLELVQRPATLERLKKAVALYKGPYLGRIEQPWAVHLRNILVERYTEAQVELANSLAPLDSQAALEHYRAALQCDPAHVGAIIGAMLAESALGRRTQALGRFHSYATHMVNELGLDPDRAVDQVYRRILNDA